MEEGVNLWDEQFQIKLQNSTIGKLKRSNKLLRFKGKLRKESKEQNKNTKELSKNRKNSDESRFGRLIALTTNKHAKTTGNREIENHMQNNYLQEDI